MIDKDGMQPWEICGLCHGLDGVSAMAKFPKLAGQHAAYIEKQFRDFHAGTRGNDGGQMQVITTEVDPETLGEIANYFARLPAPEPLAADGAINLDHGRSMFLEGREGVRPCAACHDATSVGGDDYVAPWLEAQHRDYLVKQLNDFLSGARRNDPAGVMREVVAQLYPGEIEALAAYLSAETRPSKEP